MKFECELFLAPAVLNCIGPWSQKSDISKTNSLICWEVNSVFKYAAWPFITLIIPIFLEIKSNSNASVNFTWSVFHHSEYSTNSNKISNSEINQIWSKNRTRQLLTCKFLPLELAKSKSDAPTKWIITKFSEVCVQSAGKWYEHRGVEGSCWMWNVLIDSVFNAFHSTLPSVRFGKKICQVRVGCFLVLTVWNATNYEIVGAAFHRTQWLSRKFVP